ncbi:hypothetical protein [Lactococcus lactis]|jgi:tetratricopeptide (TPR) repeat protein|uniref:hypothetical protein n=1 Tax=Lactococcus lactis TaxID=1358 RepID=UPI0021A767A5|nr:hypothetical protein [Lactococcus lactis]MCT3097699.1 hypothetical protein [Lactococcus lactis]
MNNDSHQGFLIPANEKFDEYFREFMKDDFSKSVIIKQKANTARQYAEGIMDLLLYKTKIEPFLTPKQKRSFDNKEKRNRTICIEIMREKYSVDIANKFEEVMKTVGNAGSHFASEITQEQLQIQRKYLQRIIEDIFIEYFLDKEHIFGTENIFYIFSMLTLDSRIYILEELYSKYKNQDIVERLAMAYEKNGQQDKAIELLKNACDNKIIDIEFLNGMERKLEALRMRLPDVQKLNSIGVNDKATMLKATNGLYVFGYPSNKNSFDIREAVKCFRQWFDVNKDKYPEFINLFLSIMMFDDRDWTSDD